MKLPYVFLLMICICILVAAVMMVVYLYRNHQDIPYYHNEKQGRHASSYKSVSETMSMDYTMHWPEMNIFFHSEKMEDILFLSWQGAVKKKDRYLFLFTEKDTFSAFLSACARLFEENEVPLFMFDAVFKENGRVSEIQDQVLIFMQKYHYSYKGVLQDDGSFSHLSGINVTSALIGVGYSGVRLYTISGDNEDYDWSAQLHSGMFHTEKDEYLASLMERLNRTFDLHVPFGLWKSRTDTITHMIPESVHWFYPCIEKSENMVYMYYENDDMMQENERILLSSAKKHSVHIKKETESHSCSFMMIDSSFYDRCQKAVSLVYQCESIPVYMNVPAKEQVHLGCNVIHFAPVLNHSRYGASDSILFYEQFLVNRKL